jgi:two-component system OmpR family response regulator
MDILLIEDDDSVAGFICRGLERAGYNVEWAADGDTGYAKACADTRYDVLIVDRMLPGRDGLSVVKELRAQENFTPILILSALGEVDDRVSGLQAGADDYLTKPFSFAELQARVEVLSRRRRETSAPTTLSVEGLKMDLLHQRVTRDGQLINLQPREYKLLEYLLRNVGQVVTRTMLLEHVWGYHFDPQTNVIDVHISRLRQKIDKGFEAPLLATVRGAGYMLCPPQEP